MKVVFSPVVFFLSLFVSGHAAQAQEDEPTSGERQLPEVLSPALWPDGELDKYLGLNRSWFSRKPEAEGEKAMIVGTSGALAVRAGLAAHGAGGSAVDMALTTALTQIALSAGCWNSYAGILSMVIFEKESGIVYALDAGYDVPLGESKPESIPPSGVPSGRSALIPGFMAGVGAAHGRFGKLPFYTLFEPSIYLAENGFPLDPVLGGFMKSRTKVLARRKETRQIFFDQGSETFPSGYTFRQPLLAQTLRSVSLKGASYMYSGEWARNFVETIQSEGGRITLQDMKSYSPTWAQPLTTSYRGVDVYGTGSSSSGALHAIEALNFLELANLGELGAYPEDGKALYWMIQVARMGNLISYSPSPYLKYLFPDLSFTPEERVSKKNADAFWAKMKTPGWIQKFQGMPQAEELLDTGVGPEREESGGHSDAIVAVDSQGNVVALTHTINTTAWGATGIFVNGVSIPDSACFQQAKMRTAGPGGRVPNEMNPLLFLKDEELVLACSSIGRSLHEVSLQCVHQVLDQGLGPKAAAESPFFLGMLFGVERDGVSKHYQQAVAAGVFSDEVLSVVRAMGQPVTELSQAEQRGFKGYWVGITKEAGKPKLTGGLGSELNGYAVGE